jgi:SAM-dependent methyltransferase
MAARDAQAGDYDRMLGLKLFSVPEIPLTLRYLAPEPDHLMLEAGCGTGRMTAAFARRVRGLVCVDFSLRSLMAARAKLPPNRRRRFCSSRGTSAPCRCAGMRSIASARSRCWSTCRRRARGAGRWTSWSACSGRAPTEAASRCRPTGGERRFPGRPPNRDNTPAGSRFFGPPGPRLAALADAAGLDVAQHTGALLYHFLFWDGAARDAGRHRRTGPDHRRAGFLGRNLAAGLARGGTPIIATARRVPEGADARLRWDVLDVPDFEQTRALLERHRPAWCITSPRFRASGGDSGTSGGGPRALDANVAGTWNVLEAARQAGVSAVVVASSDKQYGALAPAAL